MIQKSQTYRQNSYGFTLIEVLVVIIVIAILASLSIVAYTGIQQRARDAERQTDMEALAEAIEVWRVEENNSGGYPAWGGAMNSSTWVAENLGIDPEIIIAPGGSTPSSLVTWQPTTSEYRYMKFNPDGTDCGATHPDDCHSFRLQWRQESDNALRTIDSLQQ